MRVFAFFPVHYGVHYFRQAIAALAPVVEKTVVVYSPNPSYGQAGRVSLPPEETEEALRACCDGFKVDWYRGNFCSESDHRRTGYDLCREADLLVQCDTDEVWDTAALADCIRRASDCPAGIFPVRNWFHFWRSFDWCCRDVWTPTRLLRPRGGPGDGSQTLDGKIYHFGYAVPPDLMRYKWSCHGHKNELRTDCDWMNDVYLAWPQRKTDLHPCVYLPPWWNAEPFDKSTLPESLKSHPFYGLETIN